MRNEFVSIVGNDHLSVLVIKWLQPRKWVFLEAIEIFHPKVLWLKKVFSSLEFRSQKEICWYLCGLNLVTNLVTQCSTVTKLVLVQMPHFKGDIRWRKHFPGGTNAEGTLLHCNHRMRSSECTPELQENSLKAFLSLFWDKCHVERQYDSVVCSPIHSHHWWTKSVGNSLGINANTWHHYILFMFV